MARILFEAFEANRLKIAVDARLKFSRTSGHLRDDVMKDLMRRASVKWRVTRETGLEDRSESVDICRFAEDSVFHLLRRHESRSARRIARSGQSRTRFFKGSRLE